MLLMEARRETEIGEFDVSTLVNKDIVGLNVTGTRFSPPVSIFGDGLTREGKLTDG